MLIEHQGRQPKIHQTAYVAPNAIICGDVTIGENSRILFGAIINGDEGPIKIGNNCIVMESVIIKSAKSALTQLKDNILVGARAYLSGCVIEECVSIAPSATILNNSIIGARVEIGINSIVFVNTHVPSDTIIPLGYVALGSNPIHILPASEQGKIWHIARRLNLTKTIWNIEAPGVGAKETVMHLITQNYAESFKSHCSDKIID